MLVDSSNSTAGSTVTGAIRQAAQATGTSFQYLLATAQVESGLNPQAGASTSSARGLFQFVEQTWLGTMKQAGPALGYGQYAAAITKTASGHYEVQDPAMRSEILKLRNDPTANAVMAGAFTQANAALLSATARPRAERRRTLHRAFSRRRRRGAADLGGRRAIRMPAPRAIFPMPRTPILRSSTTARRARRGASRKCAMSSPRATTWRRACGRADPAKHGASRECGPLRRRFPPNSSTRIANSVAIDGRRQRRRRDANDCRRRAVPDTAGMTNAFAAAAPAPRRDRTTKFSTACFRIPAAPGRSRRS